MYFLRFQNVSTNQASRCGARWSPTGGSRCATTTARKPPDHIQEGEGLDDLVQDLRDVTTFARRYKTELSKVAKPEEKAKRATSIA